MLLNVTAYTGGINVPGARFRVRQYIAPLCSLGVNLVELPSRFGSFPPANKGARPLWAARSLASRTKDILSAPDSGITLLQREMLSTFYTLERITRRPRVLDVDDAIWLFRGGRAAQKLAANCDAIICGNTYLAEWFHQWNKSIYILPTAVDTDRYRPSPAPLIPGEPVIGWSGESSAFRYLNAIAPALASVLSLFPKATLRVMSNAPPALPGIPESRIQYVPWSKDVEVRALQDMTVGLMPLDSNLWSRGKCSYKMLLYMSCGVPVVVSPVGMNAEVLGLADIGIGPRTQSEWVDSLAAIIGNPDVREHLGRNARAAVLAHYSVARLAPRLASDLKTIGS